MLRSPTVVKVRRGIARGADAVLASLRLVEERPRPRPSVAWAHPMDPSPAPRPVPEPPIRTEAPGLSREAVQAVLDEMVRPALQSDGGDITLVDVVGGDVMVRLVGACHSCPSAVLTMKMGVEQLLAEELEGFERLIQIEAPAAPGFE